jgi:predicted nucleic acid-binding protein
MILDASSIYRAIEIDYLEKLTRGKTIDLALYELGNVIWKEVVRKKISLDEGIKLLEFVSKTLSLMAILKIGIRNEVLKVAVESNLGYYDASYLYASISQDEILVTEDEKLLGVAVKHGIRAQKLEEI